MVGNGAAAAPERPNNKKFNFRKFIYVRIMGRKPLEIPLSHYVRGGMVRTIV